MPSYTWSHSMILRLLAQAALEEHQVSLQQLGRPPVSKVSVYNSIASRLFRQAWVQGDGRRKKALMRRVAWKFNTLLKRYMEVYLEARIKIHRAPGSHIPAHSLAQFPAHGPIVGSHEAYHDAWAHACLIFDYFPEMHMVMSLY
ncbi:hypothetical protein BDV93DRAFT_545451 [Ceratobasidium sp. AG-I]|nr:hypothetical protein BDV93DRAFT_545451 [Ceratobasidium sp. AG-I]